MPHGYEVMRDQFAKKMGLKAAKKKAAMIWNSKHKGAEAVGPHRESIQSFVDFMEDYPGQIVGGGGNEGNEQGASGAATSSKDMGTGVKLKKPKSPEESIKKPEEVVKPLANESLDEVHPADPLKNPFTRKMVADTVRNIRTVDRKHSKEAPSGTAEKSALNINHAAAGAMAAGSYPVYKKFAKAGERMYSLSKKLHNKEYGMDEMKITERHQTNAYKATKQTDVNLSTGAVSPTVKKAMHKGLISSPTKETARGAYKDLSGTFRSRIHNQGVEENMKTLEDFTKFMDNYLNEVKHIGFKAAAAKAAKGAGVSKERGAAIIAASARKASAKAKAKNPRLKRVHGA